MLLRFGASGGTYGISALLKKARPEMNVAYVSFFMDASVVAIAFFVYGMKITPVICTLLNLFISTMIVDSRLSGGRAGYKFEIVTTEPDELSRELIDKLHHGVTELRVHGMYSDTDKYMLVCIINKRQIGEMLRILKNHPDCFVNFYKINEVLGNYNRKV
jgi:uncharacterized membrane-anchored protein YitT (DUF2179 family)